jgi:gliding motility-associated-like protein
MTLDISTKIDEVVFRQIMDLNAIQANAEDAQNKWFNKIELYDNDGLLDVRPLSDTSFFLKPFTILIKRMGSLMMITDSTGIYDTLSYIIKNVDSTSQHFGGNFVLTPNGDGQNDYLNVNEMLNFFGIVPNQEVKISLIDSKGRVLIKALYFDPTLGFEQWDGTVNGHPLPNGVYWIIVSVRGKIFYFTITIIR